MLYVLLAAFAVHNGETLRGNELESRVARQTITCHGWTLHVDARLFSGSGQDVGRRLVRSLSARLAEISAAVPTAQVRQLRRIPFYVDLHHRLRVVQYHSSAKWLEKHGMDVSLAKSIHVPDAIRFIELLESKRQPWVVMHELAHGYHDLVLGYGDPGIKQQYQRILADTRWRTVLHRSHKRIPHYARKDQKEFFAEMSETYLGRNDFFPFTASELRRFDPEVYELMRTIWSVKR